MSIVIITGGSRGLGASIATQCARRSMGVILTYDSDRQAAEKVISAIESGGGKAVASELDVSNSATFPAFRDAVGEALARTWNSKAFDVLVNNAYGRIRGAARRPGPLGRVGEPNDVGCMVASLLSDENRWANAQNIAIGGGYII